MTTGPQITVVTCLRDEGPFVVDWIAHLRAIGVTRILAYTNDCRDGTGALLDTLAPTGVVHEPLGKVRGRPGPAPQWQALRAAWTHPAVEGAEWVACLDCDEYPALTDGDLPGLIASCGDAQAIAMPWRLFGWSGRVAPGAGPTPVRFDRCARSDMAFPAQASFFKTLFRRDGPFDGFGIHRPRQTATPRFADAAGSLSSDLAANPGRILLWPPGDAGGDRRVQLNHYSIRSAEEFLIKRERGLPSRTGKEIGLAYWIERNFNQTTCDRIARHLGPMVEGAKRLRALPGVAEAEAAARAAHAASLERILATGEGARMLARLILAGGSTPPPAPLARRLLDLYRTAREAAE